jgi:excisionase family DNA binding protein
MADNDKVSGKLLTYTEAAEFLGLRRSTLYTFVSQGRVPCVRLGPRNVRFEADRLETWVASHRVEPEERP